MRQALVADIEIQQLTGELLEEGHLKVQPGVHPHHSAVAERHVQPKDGRLAATLCGVHGNTRVTRLATLLNLRAEGRQNFGLSIPLTPGDLSSCTPTAKLHLNVWLTHLPTILMMWAVGSIEESI